jgi:DNA invertase Pin-like site-specific DNA recombinase
MGSEQIEAVPYYRVSTDEQANGRDAQSDACWSRCAKEGWVMAEPGVDDDVSGGLPVDERPGLIDALSRLGRGGILLVTKRDRLGRDMMVTCMIEAAVKKKGGRIVSIAGEGTDGDKDDPSQFLLRRVADLFAEYERLMTKARTRAALAAMKRRGRRTGGIPLGHDLADDGERSKRGNRPNLLVPNEAELATLATIAELKAGGLSLRAVAAELDRLGVPTKTDAARWHHSTIAKLVNRTG